MTRLVVFSHKPCWRSTASPTGIATDGGFPFQMRALSELFDETTVLVPVSGTSERAGQIQLVGHHLNVTALSHPAGKGLVRKAGMIFWVIRNAPILFNRARKADVIHCPIPGDIGTIGILLAIILRKPLFVRHCGNWEFQRTAAEKFWRIVMEKFAGGRNVMLATGGSDKAPSTRNPRIKWIFSTSLTDSELAAYQSDVRTIDPQRPRLIVVGRLETFKGIDSLISSMPLLLDRFPALKLDIVGDGDEMEALQALARESGVIDNMTFHGRQNHEQVIRLLRGADLFCYPTRSDGFPKAVLEALACGLPVITTRVSVLPRLIGSGAGVLLDSTDPESILKAVEYCLADDKRYQRMSCTASQTAHGYSLENWRDTIGNHLRQAGINIRAT